MVAEKHADDYLIRIPSWSDRSSVSVYRNGQRTALQWAGPALSYARFADARVGEELTVAMPWPSSNKAWILLSGPSRSEVSTRLARQPASSDLSARGAIADAGIHEQRRFHAATGGSIDARSVSNK